VRGYARIRYIQPTPSFAWRIPMETTEIEVFLALAEELHFGRTAERLWLSQPRVSRLIASLERQADHSQRAADPAGASIPGPLSGLPGDAPRASDRRR
jgi:DNA-binding MarR family transcriptional regulator